MEREGGYTRVVRTEPKNKYDQGESAILEFVDGPKDSRFMMTAKTVARDRLMGRAHTAVTQTNVKKVTQFREANAFEDMVQRFMVLNTQDSAVASDTASSPGMKEARAAADRESKAAKDLAQDVVPESAASKQTVKTSS
jgi:hypothetical protein